jgi:hypothetical protein
LLYTTNQKNHTKIEIIERFQISKKERYLIINKSEYPIKSRLEDYTIRLDGGIYIPLSYLKGIKLVNKSDILGLYDDIYFENSTSYKVGEERDLPF